MVELPSVRLNTERLLGCSRDAGTTFERAVFWFARLLPSAWNVLWMFTTLPMPGVTHIRPASQTIGSSVSPDTSR